MDEPVFTHFGTSTLLLKSLFCDQCIHVVLPFEVHHYSCTQHVHIMFCEFANFLSAKSFSCVYSSTINFSTFHACCILIRSLGLSLEISLFFVYVVLDHQRQIHFYLLVKLICSHLILYANVIPTSYILAYFV